MTHQHIPTVTAERTAASIKRLRLRVFRALLGACLRRDEWRLARLYTSQERLRAREKAIAYRVERNEAELSVTSGELMSR